MRKNHDFRKYYNITEKIGEGKGIIYKAIKKDTNEERAINVINKKIFNLKEYFKSEINNMIISEGKNKDNENTVKFYEYFDTEEEFVLVMELCDENMLNFIAKRKELKPIEIYDILYQLNNTFKIMYENNIIQRNLILNKILLKYETNDKTKYKVKLKLSNGNTLLTQLKKYMSSENFKYSIRFNAPELLNGDTCNAKCDLWSLGIIIYILLFKEYPYKGNNEKEILYKIKNDG